MHSVGCFVGARAVAGAAPAKNAISNTRDRQHENNQRQRILRGEPISGSRESLYWVKFEKSVVTYKVTNKTIDFLSVASEGMNSEAQVVDLIKEVVATRKFMADDSEPDES
jgi:hypothetical protein